MRGNFDTSLVIRDLSNQLKSCIRLSYFFKYMDHTSNVFCLKFDFKIIILYKNNVFVIPPNMSKLPRSRGYFDTPCQNYPQK